MAVEKISAPRMIIAEKARILNVLKATQGDMAEAARRCGIAVEQIAEIRHWYETEVCAARVFYQAGAAAEEEVQSLPDGNGPEVEKLPLIVRRTACVRFRKRVYKTDREGLYRFLWVPEYQRNLIVFNGNHSIRPVLEGLANLHVHGNRDQDELFQNEFQRHFQTQPWVSATCGGIARSARLLLQEIGLSTRQAGTLTMDRLNTCNNGHWMLEVRDPLSRDWMLADLDLGLMFRGANGFLNLHEFREKVLRNERPEFVVLSRKSGDPFFLAERAAGGFNYSYLIRWMNRDEDAQWQWYRRIAQVVGLSDEEKKGAVVYCGDTAALRALHGDHVFALPEDIWLKRFYA